MIEPVDNLEGFRNYRSPFAKYDGAGFSHPHAKWCFYRDTYEQTGSYGDLGEMLRFVTLDNPPLAPKQTGNSRIRPGYPVLLLIGAILVIGPLVSCLVGGLLAGLAPIWILACIYGVCCLGDRLCIRLSGHSAG